MPDIAPQISWLRRLVAHDTTSSKSNLALIDDVEAFLKDHGAETHRVWNAERTKANLYAIVGPNIEGGVILSGHTDVVPVEGQDWSSDPFVLTEKDGRLYGRGDKRHEGVFRDRLVAPAGDDEGGAEAADHLRALL